jgi:hypothetical protein
MNGAGPPWSGFDPYTKIRICLYVDAHKMPVAKVILVSGATAFELPLQARRLNSRIEDNS